ncbi:diguanylate cyclase domain-containing protein [Lacticigenium naphthae]|uniref:diguanylate cyclase domain-containing protein n=1 Tax=Lacticigenium naphthae TaxID=515351 RepID=UPI000412CC74|nr:diguanylate cyclase [Lacticigenium naphthae]
MKKKLLSLTVALVAAFLLIWPAFTIQQEHLAHRRQSNKLAALQELNTVTENIQILLNTSLYYTDFFEVYLKTHDSIPINEMGDFAETILQQNNIIDNVSLAPQGIVSDVWPLEGNESAIGHDTINDPNRSKSIDKAIKLKTAVAQGPVESKQGGLKIFNRKPIFLENGKFWGFITVTVDFEELILKSHLNSEENGFLLALRVEDISGTDDFLWGNTDIFNKNALYQTVKLPNEEWEIGIYPEKGWSQGYSLFVREQAYYFALITVIFLLVYRFVDQYQVHRYESKRDSLTGVYNKKSIEQIVRRKLWSSKQSHALIVIDFNNFKYINDTFGHIFGDIVLKKSVERMHQFVSSNGAIGRVGGDEFLLFIPNVPDENQLREISKSLSQIVNQPLMHKEDRIEVSISIGATLTDLGLTFDELYNQADIDMYRYKSTVKSLEGYS